VTSGVTSFPARPVMPAKASSQRATLEAKADALGMAE
jgi:hypothetical protein